MGTKKSTYLSLLLLVATINCADLDPATSKNKIKMGGYYGNVEFGVLKYGKKRDQTLVSVENFRAGNNRQDKITFTKTTPALSIGVNAGIEFMGLPSLGRLGTSFGRLGTSLTFAKNNNAIQGNYFGTEEQVIRQDIKRFEWLLVGEYDLLNLYGFASCLDVGIGVNTGPLSDLKSYEKNNSDIFTGERLIAKKGNFAGRIGLSLQKEVKGFVLGIGYKIGFTKQKFQNYLILDEPDSRAATRYQTNYRTYSAASQSKQLVFIPPTFNLYSHEIKITIGKEF
ncbi:MAG: hypothetical protein EBZ47_07245 [Chlamydiae bacterium]|nr:hypothetical protein [Chlamydiota bacterium]